MSSSACVPMSKPNAKASTSPSTPSGPTICEFSRGRGPPRGSRPELRFGAHTRQCPDRRGAPAQVGAPFFFWGDAFAVAKRYFYRSIAKALNSKLVRVPIVEFAFGTCGYEIQSKLSIQG